MASEAQTEKTFTAIFSKLGPWLLCALIAYFTYEARELRAVVYQGQTRIVVLETRLDAMIKDQQKVESKLDEHITLDIKKFQSLNK